MKKIFLLLIVILLTGCVKENIKDSFNVSFLNVDYSSNMISVEVINKDNLDLKYQIIHKNKVIKEEEVNDNKIVINDLNSNTKYKIKIYNDNDSVEKDIKTSKITTIRFGGDTMMTSFFADYINKYGVDYMWEDVSPLLKDADYSLVNLETSVSDRGSDTKPSGYGFRSKPNTLQGIVNAGINLVSLANNHVLDYGMDAFLDTMSHLKDYGIEYVGAGKNIEEAIAINYQKINELTISFMGATSILGYPHWEATENRAGVMALKKEHYEKIKAQIKIAKENSDYVILVLHWGNEYHNTPNNDQISLAHQFIDSGVDIIIGHHPHVLQGIEYYNNGVVFYSTGNFNFLINDENCSQTALFEIQLDNKKILKSKIYPIKISYCKANLLNKENKTYKTIINNMNERSSIFNSIIDNDGNITKK